MTKTRATSKAKASSNSAPAAPRPSATVMCRLGANSPVGGLMVGNARIEAKKAARIPRGEFDRLQTEYDLVEVEG